MIRFDRQHPLVTTLGFGEPADLMVRETLRKRIDGPRDDDGRGTTAVRHLTELGGGAALTEPTTSSEGQGLARGTTQLHPIERT